MASGHSTRIVKCIRDPKFEGLNLTVAGSRRVWGTKWQIKSFILDMASGNTIDLELSIHDPKFKGSNPVVTRTMRK
jgi:hypothetical protein